MCTCTHARGMQQSILLQSSKIWPKTTKCGTSIHFWNQWHKSKTQIPNSIFATSDWVAEPLIFQVADSISGSTPWRALFTEFVLLFWCGILRGSQWSSPWHHPPSAVYLQFLYQRFPLLTQKCAFRLHPCCIVCSTKRLAAFVQNSLRKVDLLSWFHHWHQHFASVALLIQMTSILRRVLLHWQHIFAPCCCLLIDIFVALAHS